MKMKKIAVCVAVCLILCGTCALVFREQSHSAGEGKNLALQKGVTATSDSSENDTLLAAMAIDGNDWDLQSRWSSENNWEDASHYIELEFPEEISVSFVVLKWERRNVISYALEGSLDGVTYQELERFETAPESKRQEIALKEPVTVKYLRLTTYAVSRNTEDYSNLYQNVSLYEFEVYADKPAAYQVQAPELTVGEDGSRYLELPETPEGYTLQFIGADYEQVIGADGTIYDTIEEKEVTVGYRVEDKQGKEEAREISFTLTIPAGEETQDEKIEEKTLTEQEKGNACPLVIPALEEWRGETGTFSLSENSRVLVARGADERLQAVAELFVQQYADARKAVPDTAREAMEPVTLEVVTGSLEDLEPGDIYLGYADTDNGLGKEGYMVTISDSCVIEAEQITGLRWGTVTLLQLLEKATEIPQGEIRDYPKYEVRGFGIDVARKAVSMDTLYAMLETMSYYKMNDFAIHLNDNTILSTSGLTGSVEQAMTADSAFRLESDIRNDAGDSLTSGEYAYSKEEFAAFIEKAGNYGVTVVPEIDTPAHSLSITKLYPEYALTTRTEAVDQIDLSNEKAKQLVEAIWKEALEGEDAPFRQAEIVNIGMDEYYGDGEQYRQFLSRINELVQQEGKTVRLWGSLSNIGGTTVPDTADLQMNVWSTLWADPVEMYQTGYSIINMQNNHLYSIPGGGYDYLDTEELYRNWEPNRFYDYNQSETIPAYSQQMLGAAYMLWNDMSGNLDLGLTEYDLYERFEAPLPVLAEKLWGAGKLADYETYRNEKHRQAEAATQKLYDTQKGIEPSYEITMKVYLEENEGISQVLAENDSAYGTWAFYAVEPESGQVGFAREGKTYTFPYTLPKQEWTTLTLVGELGQTSLYVNGERIATLGNTQAFEEYATFVFPVERIGEETGQFAGQLEITWE